MFRLQRFPVSYLSYVPSLGGVVAFNFQSSHHRCLDMSRNEVELTPVDRFKTVYRYTTFGNLRMPASLGALVRRRARANVSALYIQRTTNLLNLLSLNHQVLYSRPQQMPNGRMLALKN